MDVFSVALFGHRRIDDLQRLERALAPMIKELIKSKQYVSFFVGRNGEFDEYAASLVKHAQKECGKENNDITLVLPYHVANLEYYEKYYDNIMIPETVYSSHPKRAITLKNRWMVEKADLIIVYVEHTEGGAYMAMKYAEKLDKNIINLCEHMDSALM